MPYQCRIESPRDIRVRDNMTSRLSEAARFTALFPQLYGLAGSPCEAEIINRFGDYTSCIFISSISPAAVGLACKYLTICPIVPQ